MKRSKGPAEAEGRMSGPAKGRPAPLKGADESIDTPSGDAEYWQSRAERTRNESRRYKQNAVRDHFLKIAAGYDELARRARESSR